MLDQPAPAEALRRLRELSGLSQRVAARQIGIDKRTLRSWEDGRTAPGSDQVDRATRVYGRDLEWFLDGRDPITDPTNPGMITVGCEVIDTTSIRSSHPAVHDANRAILQAYLDAVRRARGIPIAGIVELRALDLQLLAAELDVSDPELAGLLADIFNLTPAGAQSATRAVLIGSLMTVAVASIIGGPWFTPTASASTPEQRPTPATAEVSGSVGPLFATSPFDGSPEPDYIDEAVGDVAGGEMSAVFSVSPREASQVDETSWHPFSTNLDQGLHALPAGSPELPDS